MTFNHLGNGQYNCVSGDTKRTDVVQNATCLETDTLDEYILNGSSWKLFRSVKEIESHLVFKSGSTYYAINKTDGGMTSNSSFSSLLINIMNTYDNATGGRILIKKGTHMVDVTNPSGGLGPVGIAIPTYLPYVEILGEGWGTILKASDPNQLMLRDDNDGTTGSASYVRVANLQIDGSKANNNMIANRSCVVFFKRSDVVYDNLYVHDGPYQGISFAGEGRYPTSPGASRCRVSNCYVANCNNNGYDIGSAYFQMKNCVSVNNSNGVGTGNNAGLDFDSAQYATVNGYISIGDYFGFITGTAGIRNTNQCELSNIYIINPTHYGFNNYGAKNVQVTNLYVENSGLEAVRLSDGAQDTIFNNLIINGTVAGNGINILQGSNNQPVLRTTINGLRIYNVINSGNASSISLGPGSDYTTIDNFKLDTFEQCGILNNGGLGLQASNGNILNGTTLDGVRLLAGTDFSKITNVHVTNARNGFIVLAQANNVIIANCTAYNNKRHGFSTFGGLRTTFNTCYAWDNGSSLASTYDGFNLDGDGGSNGSSTQCRLISCYAYDSRGSGSKTQRYGLAITSFGVNTFVELCDIRNNVNALGVLDNGSNTKFGNNIGDYVTEAQGLSATQSGNGSTSSFNIAHGLSKAPTYAIATAQTQDAIGPLWVTSDATNITINYATPPRSGTNNLRWYWRALV